jgi:hypothetical protein
MDTSWVRNLTRSLRWGSVAALVAVGISSCDDATGPSQGFGADLYFFDVQGMITEGDCMTLWAGQTIDAGEVCVSVDNANHKLTVTYSTSGDWVLDEAHLWIGTNPAAMPQTNNGHPKIGNFPHKAEDLAPLTTYSFTVLLSSLGLVNDVCADEELFIAAHAVVLKDGQASQEETGWAGTDRFVDRGTWARFFPITCDETPPPQGSETAFAFGGDYATCFLDLDFHRWGWTNGPLPPGDYEFDIYAAAGQCNLGNGDLVGTLTVDFDGTIAEVAYAVDDGEGYGLVETHLYIGEDPFPQNNGKSTVAPGKYPYGHSGLAGTPDDAYVIEVCDGNICPYDIYVIAHAVVSGFD